MANRSRFPRMQKRRPYSPGDRRLHAELLEARRMLALAAADDVFNTTEDSTENFFDVLGNDGDEPERLEIVEVGLPDRNGSVTIDQGRRLLYVPAPDVFGLDQFTYIVTDGVSSQTANVRVSITPINDAPVLSSQPGPHQIRRQIAVDSEDLWYGSTVADAGDVNGDGYSDVIVGGRTARVISGFDLSELHRFTDLRALQRGVAVGGAGDVNGDGLSDLIIGDRNDDQHGTKAGAVQIRSGADGTVLFAFYGESGDELGSAVSGAGDVNADGFADVAIAASKARHKLGRVDIISGKDGSILHSILPQNNQRKIFPQSEISVAAAGDLNQDGHDDVIVGLTMGGQRFTNFGDAAVISGADGSMLLDLMGRHHSFGHSVAAVGDVNADGINDVAIGSPGVSRGAGSAFVFSGLDGTMLHRWDGRPQGDNVGYSVSGAGDVNRDGYADVLIAVPGDNAVRLYSGLDGSRLDVLSFPPTDTSAVQFATDVSDTNGDGFSELAIGDSGLVWIVAQSHVLPTDEDTPTGDIPVSSMVGTARSDIDSDVSQMGVAVRKTSGKGTWQFRRVTDEDYRDVGPVSMAESLLLNDVDFIRYVPDQENAEWATLDVVAWDGSQGVSGDRFDTSQSGGTTAFSDASVIVTLAVQGINDHPSATNLDQQHSFSVGQTTVALDDIRISDPDIDEQITATLRLNTPHVGRLTTEGFRGEVFDAETGVWTIRGTVQNVNAALADVRYLPTLRTSQKIDVTIVDGGEDGAAALAGEVQLNADVPDLTVVTQPRLERHWIIAGDATDDSFGYSVHVAGDVNGDGFGDIIIGVPGDDTKANDAGSARVVSGLDFSDIYTFHGALPGAQFGLAVAGVDDVNADGVPDLLVGAPGDSRVGFRTGSVTMYSGADGQPLYELFGDRDSQQEFGRLVIDLGDVDGDGFGDFAIGAQDGSVHPGKGATLIVYSGYRVLPIFGRDGSCSTSGRVIAAAGDVSADGVNDLLIGGCGARHQPFDTVLSGADGSFVFEFLGPHESLSGAGDINADGFDDVVAAIEGEVKIYSGESHSLLYTLDGVLEGSVQPVVSGAGDMDNDGFDDIIVATPSSPEAGRVQVFSGANRRPLYTFAGDSAQDQFGFSLGAGDINGDGLPDLVVGAPGDGKGAVDSGSVWVLRSSPTHFLLSGEIDGGAANGTPIVDLFGGFLTERERVHGAAVHSVTGAGLWQFSLDGGQTFDAVGFLDRSASLLLRPSDRIRYIGQPDDSSNATMEFILWNQTMGSAGERIDQLASETRSALLMRSAVATWPGADHPFEFSASHLSQEHTYVEDDPFVPLDRIQIVATDVDGELVASLTLRDSETGSLAPIDRATYDHETGNWTTTGTVAQVDAALAELSFVPERNNDLDTVVGIAISPVNHPAEQVLIGEIKLTVTPVNDAPTMHGRLQGIDVSDGDSKVAYAGDVDGDGLDDLLVGNGQALSVLSGLTFAKILTVRGGQSMTGVGDVNRDGMGDVLVGDGTQAFVYSGADGSTVLHLQGSSSRDDFGQSVGRIGDLNEDDVPDILIGAPQRTSAHEFRFGRGYVMVFSGADGTPIHTLLGESRSSGLGWSVNSAGDVDGDGIEDIVAGAVGDENTLVFSGRDGSVLHRVPSASYSVGGAGDVNGDGHADFLATSIGQVTTSGIQRGAVQVFSGKDGSIIAEFPEPSLLASFGASTAGLGDVDGDGLHDVVVGAPHEENENGASAGAARFFSAAGELLYSFGGQDGCDRFGDTVAYLGDINGDGKDDFAIGEAKTRACGSFSQRRVWVLLSAGGVPLPQATDRERPVASVAKLTSELVQDVDKDVRLGIAVRSATGQGTWQYSLDGGRSYSNLPAVDATSSLLLRGTDSIRYVPLAGSPEVARLDFVAWDQTSGTAGQLFDSSRTGGSTAFSKELGFAVQKIVVRVDEAPLATNLNQSHLYEEDTTVALDDIVVSDADSREEIAVTLQLVPVSAGMLTTRNAGTESYNARTGLWSVRGSLNQVNAALADVAFVPTIDNLDDASITVSVTEGGGDAPGLTGTIELHVLSVNDAPRLHTLRTTTLEGFSNALSRAGDVNGDGFDDLVVGTRCEALRCSVLIFSGKDGSMLHELPVRPFNTGTIRVSSAGDADGDGLDDVVVSQMDEVRLFSGANGFQTLWTDSEFYRDLSGAGDVNGDGLDDVVLTTRDDDAGWQVVVVSGDDQSILHRFHRTTFGCGVSGGCVSVGAAGDVNGDGLGDVLVGDYDDLATVSGPGRVYVLSGRDASVLFEFEGAESNDRFGVSLDALGDVNGDGRDDIVVGADPGGRDRHLEPGYARVYSGSDGSVLHVFHGEPEANDFGRWVSGTGDANGDGTPDVLVGAETGVYVYSGVDGSLLHQLETEPCFQSVCQEITSAGDVNGDGQGDVAIGTVGIPHGIVEVHFSWLMTSNVVARDPGDTGERVADVFPGITEDVDEGALAGVAIQDATGKGQWQYSIDGGQAFHDFGMLSVPRSLLLRDTDRIRFVPENAGADVASIALVAWDQTSGGTGQHVDTSLRGGRTSYSTESTIARLQVMQHAAGPATPVGDVNGDQRFDQQDVEHVLQSAKYLTGQPASRSQGDWNGDGVFDQLDVVLALQQGRYIAAPNAARTSVD